MLNNVPITRRLHEYKMEDEATLEKHLDSLNELIVGLRPTR